jgi:branched-chain amino acid transport system substrate-binding protein
MIGCANWECIKRVVESAARHTGIYGLVVVSLLALSGCTLWFLHIPYQGTRPLVKIGLAAPFEGLDRPLGYEALSGVKLALAERNAAGGVGGYMVELVALNDFGEPEEAYLQAGEFAADADVLGVVTGWSDETARASLSGYSQTGLAVVVPWSVAPELADSYSGMLFLAADVQRLSRVLAEAVVAVDPYRVVVIGEEPSAALYAEAIAALGREAQIVRPPSSLDGASLTQWATIMVSGRIRSPDALVVTADGSEAGEVLQALSSRGWAGFAFGGAQTGSVHLISVAGNAATGLTFVSPAPAGADLSPSVQGDSMAERSRLAPRAVLAYDATQVLLDAIEIAIRSDGYPSRQGVATALPQVRRDGLTGTIVFDVAGRRVDAPVWLYNITYKQYPGEVLASP